MPMQPLNPSALGALLQTSGSCLFRVWAPAAKCVSLRLSDSIAKTIPMSPEADGYQTAVVAGIAPGQRYVFDLGNGKVRPDPASRSQPDGVHAASAVVSSAFAWTDDGWNGPELAEYVLYELHIGTLTAAGTFDAAIGELDRLKNLGITAIEIMPVAQFPGARNWGYDGVYPFAVQHSYGGAEGLKRFVNACHGRGLAVVLDVVYNHLGPEGNYLRDFGQYFTTQYKTPWGEALNFDGPGSDHVRAYFIANALMWQTEFHIDALRLDAVHAIRDFSAYPFLAELAEVCRHRAADLGRRFYLIAESDLNDARLVRSKEAGGLGLDSMWSDDLHHALHTLLTGEHDGYYEDFGRLEHLVTAYRDGFTYRGQFAPHRGRRHGNSPAGLAPWHFVVAAQNHDQVGNRAQGERLATLIDFESLKLAAGVVLLSPFVPLLFMGEEYGETAPFLYFVSHGDNDLIEAVRHGRRQEFEKFTRQGEPPDPQDETTFLRSKLNTRLAAEGTGALLQRFHKKMLELRLQKPSLGCRGSFPAQVDGNVGALLMTCRRQANGDETVLMFHFGTVVAKARAAWPAGRWWKLLDSAAQEWGGAGSAMPDVVDSDAATPLQLSPRSFVLYEHAT